MRFLKMSILRMRRKIQMESNIQRQARKEGDLRYEVSNQSQHIPIWYGIHMQLYAVGFTKL